MNTLISLFPGNVRSYLQNAVFDVNKKDDWSVILIELKKFLKQKKVVINTYDIPTEKPPFRYIFFDLPYLWDMKFLPAWLTIFFHKERNILFCNETPIVIPHLYMKIFHIFFKKVYTWNDDWVDDERSSPSGKKYFKINLPHNSLGISTPVKNFKKKEFLVLINSNKFAFLPFKILNPLGKELYSKRIKAIEFFEKNIPNEFSLYGRGWNKPKKYNIAETIFGFRKYSTYKGEIKEGGKIEILSNFKYCICFENITGAKGYLTEKIFDCFKAKCVPIYWGATNIDKYIPKECFIDFRDFGCNFEKLLRFLKSIDEKRYNGYIKNIKKLLANKKFIATWFEKGFVNFFLKDVLEIK